MLDDAYGNPVGTRSVEARDAYDLGISRFLGAEPRVSDAFQTAINADEGFALAILVLLATCSCLPNLTVSRQVLGKPEH